MAVFKLGWRSFHRNIFNYLIYFLTVTLSISLFYAFNSISRQPAFEELGQTRMLLYKQLDIWVSTLSVLVAAVLAFLLVYANRFMLRRRKKELGIYLLLGMKKLQVSAIFMWETLLTGTAALGAGLILGIVFSQVLSVAALRLFMVSLEEFQVVFSVRALQVTMVCFLTIFVIMAIHNAWTISRVNLIDLISAERKNEECQTGGFIRQAVGLFLSGVFLSVSVYLIETRGLLPGREDNHFQISAFFAITGTLLLFRTGALVWFKLISRNEGIYYKKLNLFLSRQIASRIKTNYLVLSIVCLLLTAALCTTSVGVSTAFAINELASRDVPYDLAVHATKLEVDGDVDIAQALKQFDLDITEYAQEYAQIGMYTSDLSYGDLFAGQTLQLWDIDKDLTQSSVTVVAISDFNRALKMQGKRGYALVGDEYLLNCNYKGTMPYMESAAKSALTLRIGETDLYPAPDGLIKECYYMNAIGNNDRGTLIVPDEVADKLEKGYNMLLVRYCEEADREKLCEKLLPIGLDDEHGYRYAEKEMMYDMYFGVNALMSLICCYIGLIFLLVCVALLALKQLTETTENVYRYGVLQKLGADPDMTAGALVKQIGAFFLFPLAVAGVYSAYLTGHAIRIIESLMNIHISTNMFITALLFLLVYGGYFLATYLSAKRMIR